MLGQLQQLRELRLIRCALDRVNLSDLPLFECARLTLLDLRDNGLGPGDVPQRLFDVLPALQKVLVGSQQRPEEMTRAEATTNGGAMPTHEAATSGAPTLFCAGQLGYLTLWFAQGVGGVRFYLRSVVDVFVEVTAAMHPRASEILAPLRKAARQEAGPHGGVRDATFCTPTEYSPELSYQGEVRRFATFDLCALAYSGASVYNAAGGVVDLEQFDLYAICGEALLPLRDFLSLEARVALKNNLLAASHKLGGPSYRGETIFSELCTDPPRQVRTWAPPVEARRFVVAHEAPSLPTEHTEEEEEAADDAFASYAFFSSPLTDVEEKAS